LRVGCLMVLARLLGPKDFGLVGMVAAFTGLLVCFRDFGLSAAAVQRDTVTKEQLSTLFWVNIAFGALLALIVVAMAPAIAAFYQEPQLFGVTTVLALGFLFNSAGVQHAALLQRQMRFTVLAGARSDDGRTTPYFHYQCLDGRKLGPGDTSQAGRNSFYAAFWRHSHFERPRGLCCFQC
jgi:Polysaccharide biosynthesis protein